MTTDTTCFFSGYRPEKLPDGGNPASPLIQETITCLESQIQKAAEQGYRDFISGMSRGFDLMAAETVCRLQAELPIRLFCAVPFYGQEARWLPSEQQLYYDLLKKSHHVFCLYDHYHPHAYRERNRFMADAGRLLICWFDGQPGGTAYTVQYARKNGRKIINLADPQLSLFD